jgi:tRNA-splicing endonuclease subunit Sen2
MADDEKQESTPSTPAAAAAPGPPRPTRASLAQMYALPAPIRTYPLPPFFPGNPLSWLHIAWAVLRQTLWARPRAEPATVHVGVWDGVVGSVHVKDHASMRALWEQGFFGKGHLSRSEPNWFKRRQIELGLAQGKVSEVVTEERRQARAEAKWRRAVAEEEALQRVRERERLEDEMRAREGVVGAAAGQSEKETPPTFIAEQHAASGLLTAVPLAPLPLPREAIVADGAQPSHAAAAAAAAVLKHRWQPARPPVGPLELLALPNSAADLAAVAALSAALSTAPLTALSTAPLAAPLTAPLTPTDDHPSLSPRESNVDFRPPVGLLELLALPNSAVRAAAPPLPESRQGDAPNVCSLDTPTSTEAIDDAAASAAPAPESPRGPPRAPAADALHSPKGVRFSPLIESTTFASADPPSPQRSPRVVTPLPLAGDALDMDDNPAPLGDIDTAYPRPPLNAPALPFLTDNQAGAPLAALSTDDGPLVDIEHLQLCPEEAFFLAFGLGALTVVHPDDGEPIPHKILFLLCAQHSHYPPLAFHQIRPDTNFFVQYAVYHHYRALGWVPRGGIKFGVDWLLYYRGPVFDHAEFGVIVLPAYTDPWWRDNDVGEARVHRPWYWLHGVLRVLARVMKTFVIAYVEVPPPPRFVAAFDEGGAAAVMALYRVREVTVRRWSANRNRKAKPVR